MGLERDEPGQNSERDGAPDSSSTKTDSKFGDFFDRMRDRSDPLTRIDEQHDEFDQRNAETEQEKEKKENASTTGRSTPSRESAGDANFNPAIASRSDQQQTPGKAGEPARSGESGNLDTRFKPAVGWVEDNRSREAAQSKDRGRENPFTTSAGLLAREPSAGGSNDPRSLNTGEVSSANIEAGKIGGFRSLSSYGSSNQPGAERGGVDSPGGLSSMRISDLPSTSRPLYDSASPSASSLNPTRESTPALNGGYRIAGPSTTGNTPAARAPFGPFQTPSAPRAPPPDTYQSAFSSLRPAAVMAPAVTDVTPRADRWEKDRMRSQLMTEKSTGPGPRRTAP
jgi:hypothetical protein